MNPHGSVLTVAAAIFISWFVFRKSLKNDNKNSKNQKTSAIDSTTTSDDSSSASDSEGKYDVFLSFRGADTRHGFTDHLYNGLLDAGIYTFRDSEKLQIGEQIGPELLNAIEDSKIWIPIFSKNYADSKWCLIEFAHIVKCQLENERLKIYPVFYDVDVYDVKNQQGSYEKAFREHEKNFDDKIVKEWRDALKTVGKFKGYELKTETNGHEGGLVRKLVKDVLLALKKNYTDVAEDLVGMDHHIQEMTRLLQVEHDGVRIIGVHGMGGIGKTTIAKVVYNKLCDNFDGCCFLEDVRERAKQHPNGLVDLQKQLVLQILKRDLPDIVSVNDGVKKIKNIVQNKKVIIVLDDVDEKSQFDKVVGQCDWLNKASRIIVTTRNKEVLNALQETCSGKGLCEAYKSYEPELMTDGDSLKLFSKYAFMRESPPEDYLSLTQKVTFIASGLPLVLVTLGSLFLGIRDNASWIAKLKKLGKVPNKDVMGKLRISFDALDDENKKMFLDIACLFIGKDKREPYYMWEDCDFFPDDGIKTLVLRSLVKIGDDNKLRMHDQLRDLGRQIVREENLYKLSRVWCPKEALKVLEGGLGVENVEALRFDLTKIKYYAYEKLIDVIKQEYKELRIEGKEYYVRRLKGQSFSRLQNLRYLRLGSVILDKDSSHLFSNLRWLEWRCCQSFTQINLNLQNLVILNLSNSLITDKWEGWSLLKAAKRLKVLNMSGCLGLIRGPDLSTFKVLESLTLNSCKYLLKVGGLESLESLTNLNLKECESIARLTDLSNLKMLKELLLEGCINLRYIDGLGGLVSLEHLNMSGCKSIQTLPELSNLKMLKELLLEYCINLRDIDSLGGLESLQQLNMNGCSLIGRLPGLSNLKMLKKLHLRDCKGLYDIEGLGDLLSLEYLDMNRCKSIKTLPELSNLKMLRILYLSFCMELREIKGLGGMVSLEHLDMAMCCSILRLPDLSNLRMLRTLIASLCYNIPAIDGLGRLISLEKLVIIGCSVERLPDLSNLGKLKQLSLVNFPKLREIEGFSGLISLETLDIKYCISLMNILDFSCLKNLKTLNLEGMDHWREVRGLEELKFLQVLDLQRCRSLEKLPDLSNLTSLKNIYIEGCTKLLGGTKGNEEA